MEKRVQGNHRDNNYLDELININFKLEKGSRSPKLGSWPEWRRVKKPPSRE